MGLHSFAIRLASDAHCIADNSVYALRFCPHILATLTGPGFSHANRKFAPLSIHGVLHFADVITGTLYDAAGIHHSSPLLQVVGLPSAVVETDVTEVRID